MVFGLEEAGGAGKHVDLWLRVRGRLDVVTDFGESGGLRGESRRRRDGSHEQDECLTGWQYNE